VNVAIPFALNHITAPRLGTRALIDLAATLGCGGVELRNDLADKKLTDRPLFDNEKPAAIGDYARKKGIHLLGLSEVYGFNKWSDKMCAATERLVDQAKEVGAGSISLIPSNDGESLPDDTRLANLRHALRSVLPVLERADMIALVEPLGFTTSSLRRKREAVEAIAAVNGEHRFKLVHDTFHHFLADEHEFFPQHTGIVHISGVVEQGITRGEMRDGHRILVDRRDRLENIEQIRALTKAGYRGHYSFECFASAVHASDHLRDDLAESMSHIV
jgi:2-keto-myo-inositol isomerase